MARRCHRWEATKDGLVTSEFYRLTPSNGSGGCLRQQPSFTRSKANQILPLGTDRVNETKHGFKSRRFFTLLVLLIVIEILL
jgi:hypothetical protein